LNDDQEKPASQEVKSLVKRLFPPKEDSNAYDFVKKVCKRVHNMTNDLPRLSLQCLLFTKDKRMTAEEASRHPWLDQDDASKGTNGLLFLLHLFLADGITTV